MKISVPEKNTGEFELAPDGTHAAVLVDVVDLGEVEVDVYGKPGVREKQHHVKLVFQLSEAMSTGKPFLMSSWGMKVSLHDKAKLRKALETLNGKPFDVGQEVDPDSFIGCNCLLEVVHKKSSDGTKTYANIANIARAMKGMTPLVPRDYVRVCDRPTADEPAPDHDDSDVPF